MTAKKRTCKLSRPTHVSETAILHGVILLQKKPSEATMVCMHAMVWNKHGNSMEHAHMERKHLLWASEAKQVAS